MKPKYFILDKRERKKKYTTLNHRKNFKLRIVYDIIYIIASITSIT